jgi:hypothetical protein
VDVVRKTVFGIKWQRKTDSRKCVRCESDFSMLVRRHHCRACGLLVCKKCSGTSKLVRHLTEDGEVNHMKARVCDARVLAYKDEDVIDVLEVQTSQMGEQAIDSGTGAWAAPGASRR